MLHGLSGVTGISSRTTTSIHSAYRHRGASQRPSSRWIAATSATSTPACQLVRKSHDHTTVIGVSLMVLRLLRLLRLGVFDAGRAPREDALELFDLGRAEVVLLDEVQQRRPSRPAEHAGEERSALHADAVAAADLGPVQVPLPVGL